MIRLILSLIIVTLIITYVVIPLVPTMKSVISNFLNRTDKALTSNKNENTEEKE